MWIQVCHLIKARRGEEEEKETEDSPREFDFSYVPRLKITYWAVQLAVRLTYALKCLQGQFL